MPTAPSVPSHPFLPQIQLAGNEKMMTLAMLYNMKAQKSTLVTTAREFNYFVVDRIGVKNTRLYLSAMDPEGMVVAADT